MTSKDITIDFIIDYCKENGKVAWLKQIAKQEVECKIYPRAKDENGNEIKLKKGYKKDTKATPIIEKRPITFVQIKTAFINEFMPELKAKKAEKESMYDRIAAL